METLVVRVVGPDGEPVPRAGFGVAWEYGAGGSRRTGAVVLGRGEMQVDVDRRSVRVEVFDARTLAALLVAQSSHQPVPPSERCDFEIPPDLETLVLDCLTKDLEDRIQGAEEFVARLDLIEFRESWSQERAESWWSEAASD